MDSLNIFENSSTQTKAIRVKQLFIALFTSVVASTTPSTCTKAESVLTEFTAYYKVIKGGITVGETKRSVTSVSPEVFEFRSETSPRGIFNWISDAYVLEQSLWRLDNNEPKPLEYNYQNINDDKVRNVKLVFDWEKQRVTNIINGDPWHMALQPGLQDKLLFQLKMMQDLQNGTEALKYAVADGGKIKQYEIEIIGDEILDIALGRFKTVKLQRVTKNKTTIWWCAETLQYLPIKIQQKKQEGSRVVAQLYKLEGIPLPDTAPESTSPAGKSSSP